jgi:hypothetical protein
MLGSTPNYVSADTLFQNSSVFSNTSNFTSTGWFGKGFISWPSGEIEWGDTKTYHKMA